MMVLQTQGNMCRMYEANLELVIQDSHAMCNILSITIRGSVQVLYDNLESGSITSLVNFIPN